MSRIFVVHRRLKLPVQQSLERISLSLDQATIAGRVAEFSASTPIAANAALVAVSLLKTTPTTFAIGAVLLLLKAVSRYLMGR